MSGESQEAVREAEVLNDEGLHARPVMKFVDCASAFRSDVRVMNISRDDEQVDGKSAMEMMLLEAVKGCVLRIHTRGDDAVEAAEELQALVQDRFGMDGQS